jgi:hypothetical protein
MLRGCIAISGLVLFLTSISVVQADVFGVGANQFSIDFVPISGATNPSRGISAGTGFTFTGVANDYRMGTCEITNDQWNKFTASLGVSVIGSQGGYSTSSYFAGANMPVENTSWYEAAQFVNWLNTSNGLQPAYKFTGNQGTVDYTFVPWDAADSGYDSSNPYRNKAAMYFLPTENEWVKAGYWNGVSMQLWTTKDNSFPTRGDGTSGTGWDYDFLQRHVHYGPWDVGSGSEELNGTFDMMGDVYEWMENPYSNGSYTATATRVIRGGDWDADASVLASSFHDDQSPTHESYYIGFRVASAVPEPSSLPLLLAGVAGLLAYEFYRHTWESKPGRRYRSP